MKEKFTKFLVLFFSLLALNVSAQQKKISGTVTAKSDGLPIPGVSVQVKGTSMGTQTDVDGKFSISVDEGATVSFGYLGFRTKDVRVGTSTVLNVVLEADERQLNEVVVTALGVQRKKNELAYSAQQVKGDDLTKARESNVVNALSGKVAGLEVRRNNTMGGSTNIVLRGTKSLLGNNQALFVVDGVPVDNSNTNTTDQISGRGGYDYGNAVADINPDDIENVSVLKGGAAAALYGSRAANGVIMITTKKGSKGLGVTLNSGLTVGSIDKSTFPKFQKKYGAGYGKYYESADGYFLSRDINGDGIKDLVTPTSEDASWGAPFDPSKMVYQWDAFDPTSPNYGKATPWVAAANDPTTFFEKPISLNNSIMIDGATEKGSFKLGFSNNADKGLLPNSKIDKSVINFGGSYKLSENLKADASINVSTTKGKGRYGTGYDDKNSAGNFRQWWETNVDIKEQKDAYFRNNKNVTWNWADPSDLTPIYWDNPYFTRYENYENDSRNRYFGNLSLSYKVSNWMDIMGRVSTDSYNETQEERQAYGSVTTSSYSIFNRKFSSYNYDLMANFNKNITKDLTFKGLLGATIARQGQDYIKNLTNGGLVVPHLYTLANSLNAVNPATQYTDERQTNSAYAQTSFGYKDFLFLDGTIRFDKSSTLPAEKNVYHYPAASLGFVFSKFLASTPWISLGKVRLNYAELGNSAPAYSIVDTYAKPLDADGNAYSSYGSIPLFSVSSTKNNPNLKPEITKTLETGLEMSFFDQRIGFDLNLYKGESSNQIMPVSVSTATGNSSQYFNAGNIENKGVELSVSGVPVKFGNFQWSVNLNWSANRNKVTELFSGIDNLVIQSYQGGVTINAALGRPYGEIRGKNYTFKDGQRVVGANGYYVQSATSNQTIGNVNPDWIGGITNTFKYKNAQLSFLIDTKHGGSVFSLDQYYGLATGMYEETAGLNDLGNPVRNPLTADNTSGGVIVKGVLADGTPNTKRVPATNFGIYGYSRNPAAAFVYDASFVKLREVALTYSLPASVLSHVAPLKGVDFSVIGRNLWIISKNLPNADPEDGISSGNAQGYQTGSYPTARTFGFNVKFKF